MDYSIFKPGDKVRGKHEYSFIKGTVLFSHEMCLVIQRVAGTVPEYYSMVRFEKIPERTSKFCNVYLNKTSLPAVMTAWYRSKETALSMRIGVTYIGMFEQVFEDDKLVKTKYHPDENA